MEFHARKRGEGQVWTQNVQLYFGPRLSCPGTPYHLRQTPALIPDFQRFMTHIGSGPTLSHTSLLLLFNPVSPAPHCLGMQPLFRGMVQVHRLKVQSHRYCLVSGGQHALVFSLWFMKVGTIVKTTQSPGLRIPLSPNKETHFSPLCPLDVNTFSFFFEEFCRSWWYLQ